MLRLMPQEYSMEMGQGYDNMISCAIVVSVSASYSKCYDLISFSLFPHVLWLVYFMDFSLLQHVV